MVKSTATTVQAYLEELPADRREAVQTVREAILANLPEGYVETMQWGMPSYVIPLARHGDTYNKQPLALVSLANQKNYMAVYLNNVYGDPEIEEWFTSSYKATGKRLDMGKSCVRFKTLDDLPIELVGEAVSRTPVEAFIATYVEARRSTARGH
jgi:uncharacterized protein YdhG (YjbR/CyaY superfamily)